MKEDFYITLFSNSSMDFYKENKTSSYTVQLPRSMSLSGDWSVALTEFQYPYSFFNVQDGDNEIRIKTLLITTEIKDWVEANPEKASLANVEAEFHYEWIECKITPGFYESEEKLILAVNDAIEKAVGNVTFFVIDESSKRLEAKPESVSVGKQMILAITFSNRLSLQLGYTPGEEISENNGQSIHVVNLISGIPDKMLIYCDIVEPQIVGDKWAKVIRSITITPESNFGKPCSIDFTQLQYIPLQMRHFESISIDIRDTNAKLFPFQYGTSSVKLHFRKN